MSDSKRRSGGSNTAKPKSKKNDGRTPASSSPSTSTPSSSSSSVSETKMPEAKKGSKAAEAAAAAAAAAANPTEEGIPEVVSNFMRNVQRRVTHRAPIAELAQLYDGEFGKLTERFYKTVAWPNGEEMADEVVLDDNVIIVYKELYFRHIHSKLNAATTENRFDAFQNYIELFDMIIGLNAESPELELPASWLWDIIDEFISQFQSFHQFRSRVSSLSAQDLSLLRNQEHAYIWSAQTVIQYLHALVKKAQLDINKPAPTTPVGDDDELVDEKKEEETGTASMFKTLGHFALIGLLRINCVLSDYYGALKALDPFDLVNRRHMFTKVISAHVTLYYHLGFAYLMSRRYLDCIKTLSHFLLFISRQRSWIARSSASATLSKRVDQMYGLLAISTSLCPQQSLDDVLHKEINDKHADKVQRMQRGELAAFEEVLALVTPGFINTCAPNWTDVTSNQHDVAHRLQVKIFLNEIAQRSTLPDIYAHLKLCSTVSTSKLSSFLKTDEETLQTWLLNLKHKTRNMRWKGGPPGHGQWVSSTEVDYAIVKDTVAVTQHASSRRYNDFFIRHILKYEDMIAEIRGTAAAKTR